LSFAYFDAVRDILDRIDETSIRAATEWVAECVGADGIIWIFGSGHAGLLADECFYRAGGLACVSPIHIPGLLTTDVPITVTTRNERTDGFAHPNVEVSSRDILIIHSVSGRNAAPVDVALWGRERGARTIALTSVEYANASEPRNAHGKSLHEVCDLTIDNCVPVGDAVVRVDGTQQRCSPVSSVVGGAILHTIFSEVCRLLVERGASPPVFMSANMPGGDVHNAALLERYRGRVSYL